MARDGSKKTAIPSVFNALSAEFLRSALGPSRLAEPEGFEPSIRLWSV